MRKIVQIAVSGAQNESDIIYALCEDGTLWQRLMTSEDTWIEIEGVPAMPLTVGSYRFTHEKD